MLTTTLYLISGAESIIMHVPNKNISYILTKSKSTRITYQMNRSVKPTFTLQIDNLIVNTDFLNFCKGFSDITDLYHAIQLKYLVQ